MHEVIKKILKEFDEIINKIESESDNNIDSELDKYKDDLNLIKLWREELESEEQSIYVLGKTGTGKSEFHNFLLNIESKDEKIFKTSTRTETMVLQTLRHIDSKEKAYVKLFIKDINNFKKLKFPAEPCFANPKKTVEMPLIKPEQRKYLREKIMTNLGTKNGYDPSIALEHMDIYYPMGNFKDYIFVDTPGLGSYKSATDATVRKYIKGKSHIFWFFDASEKTLSDSISLLDKEKTRIIDFGNKFDLLPLGDDNQKKCKEIRENNKEIMAITFNEYLLKNCDIDSVNNNIIFTSFKHVNKELGKNTTKDEMKSLEKILESKYIAMGFENIESLSNVLSKILKEISRNILDKKKKCINNEVNEFVNKKKVTNEESNEIKKLKDEVDLCIIKLREVIDNKENCKKIKSRKDFNKRVKSLKGELNTINDRFIHIKRAYKTKFYFSKKFNLLTENIKRLVIYELEKDKRNFFIRKGKQILPWISSDKELVKKKNELLKIIEEKRNNIVSIEDAFNKDLESHKSKTSNEIMSLNEEIKSKENELEKIEKEIKRNLSLEKNLENIYNMLQDYIENRISEWKMLEEKNEKYNILYNFLQLYSLLNEHNIIIKKMED